MRCTDSRELFARHSKRSQVRSLSASGSPTFTPHRLPSASISFSDHSHDLVSDFGRQFDQRSSSGRSNLVGGVDWLCGTGLISPPRRATPFKSVRIPFIRSTGRLVTVKSSVRGQSKETQEVKSKSARRLPVEILTANETGLANSRSFRAVFSLAIVESTRLLLCGGERGAPFGRGVA